MDSNSLQPVEVEVTHWQKTEKLVKSKHTVRVNPKDNFHKIKRHITESLGIRGKLMFGTYNCDANPLEKMSKHKYSSRKEKFYLKTAQKPRGSTDSILNIKLRLDGARRVEMKVPKQETIRILKHKIQDHEYGIPAEEQAIYRLGQQREIPMMTIMQLMKQPIELVVLRKGDSPPKPPLHPAKPSHEKNGDPRPQHCTYPLAAEPSDEKTRAPPHLRFAELSHETRDLPVSGMYRNILSKMVYSGIIFSEVWDIQ